MILRVDSDYDTLARNLKERRKKEKKKKGMKEKAGTRACIVLSSDDIILIKALVAELINPLQFLKDVSLASVIVTAVVAITVILTLLIIEFNQKENLAVHSAATAGMRGVVVHQAERVSCVALRVLHKDDRLQFLSSRLRAQGEQQKLV